MVSNKQVSNNNIIISQGYQTVLFTRKIESHKHAALITPSTRPRSDADTQCLTLPMHYLHALTSAALIDDDALSAKPLMAVVTLILVAIPVDSLARRLVNAYAP